MFTPLCWFWGDLMRLYFLCDWRDSSVADLTSSTRLSVILWFKGIIFVCMYVCVCIIHTYIYVCVYIVFQFLLKSYTHNETALLLLLCWNIDRHLWLSCGATSFTRHRCLSPYWWAAATATWTPWACASLCKVSRACSCYFLPDVNAARLRPPALLIKWSLAAIIFTAHSRLQHIALDPIGLRALDMHKLCESKIIQCLG